MASAAAPGRGRETRAEVDSRRWLPRLVRRFRRSHRPYLRCLIIITVNTIKPRKPPAKASTDCAEPAGGGCRRPFGLHLHRATNRNLLIARAQVLCAAHE